MRQLVCVFLGWVLVGCCMPRERQNPGPPNRYAADAGYAFSQRPPCAFEVSATPETVPQAAVDPAVFTDGFSICYTAGHGSGTNGHASSMILANSGTDNSQSRLLLKPDTPTEDILIYRSATSGNQSSVRLTYATDARICVRTEHQQSVVVEVNGVVIDTIDITALSDGWTAGDLHVGEGASSLLPVSGTMDVCGENLTTFWYRTLMVMGQSNVQHLTEANMGGTYALRMRTFASGTDLANDWDPLAPGPEWTSALTFYQNQTGLLLPLHESRLEVLVWGQGERDALDMTKANAYGANLETLYQEVKSQYAPLNRNFLFIVLLLPSWQSQPYNSVVRAAQEAFVLAHPDVASVSGDNLWPDGVKTEEDPDLHYNPTGAAALDVAIGLARATGENQVASL